MAIATKKTDKREVNANWSAKGADYPCGDNQVGVLKISAVTTGRFIPEENKYVSGETIPAGKKLIFPKKGNLLFSRANTRELVAATCIVNDDRDDVFLPDKLWLVSLDEEELLPVVSQSPHHCATLSSYFDFSSHGNKRLNAQYFKVKI